MVHSTFWISVMLYSFSPSAQAFSSALFRRPLSIRPSTLLAPGALERSPAADLSQPLLSENNEENDGLANEVIGRGNIPLPCNGRAFD